MGTIDIAVLRPLCVRGAPYAVGEVLSLPALEAGHVLLSGRAALVREEDRGTVREALQAEASRFVGRERGGLVGAFGQGPWQ